MKKSGRSFFSWVETSRKVSAWKMALWGSPCVRLYSKDANVWRLCSQSTHQQLFLVGAVPLHGYPNIASASTLQYPVNLPYIVSAEAHYKKKKKKQARHKQVYLFHQGDRIIIKGLVNFRHQMNSSKHPALARTLPRVVMGDNAINFIPIIGLLVMLDAGAQPPTPTPLWICLSHSSFPWCRNLLWMTST